MNIFLHVLHEVLRKAEKAPNEVQNLSEQELERWGLILGLRASVSLFEESVYRVPQCCRLRQWKSSVLKLQDKLKLEVQDKMINRWKCSRHSKEKSLDAKERV